jgi:hypothetical protein
MRRLIVPLLAVTLVLAGHRPARGQTFESVGTRAAGMGGAFVAVADDASAVYWNPAGLALGGAFFSVVLDTGRSDADAGGLAAGKQSSTLVSLATLPLGVSYYRSSLTRVSAAAGLPLAPAPRYERLTTHHAGLTVVQSVTQTLAIASTLKAVRGVAASGVLLDAGSRRLDDLLDADSVLPDRATTRVTADIGAMARLGTAVRLGLTVRNVTEPDFDTPQGGAIELQRQSRAGIAYLGVTGIMLAADVDIEKARGPVGEVRNVAGGAELRLTPRALARAGLRFNALSDQPGGHAPVGTVGGSFATVRSIFVDGHVTFGSTSGDRGWGIAARIVY